jgi:hypothetical protein
MFRRPDPQQNLTSVSCGCISKDPRKDEEIDLAVGDHGSDLLVAAQALCSRDNVQFLLEQLAGCSI